ncbi:flagellar basal body P-ring formation chaperone FlgA [Glaciecola sp. KUL10]|uniref:flagellar basal body P-ring formation chaperone FlgA n=1 Tax=Glaciecola sp. (strain KUL10) TaxID=2161813 RepID=UPI001F15C29A|nr:flagellar basal body P-ring formation chaperone FlgA [Glaciecola sp. KUL10]
MTLFCISFSSLAYENIQDMLGQQAQAYVEQNILRIDDADTSIIASGIDPRIEIPQCDDLFQFEASPASLRQSNVSVKITCPSSTWYLFTNVQVKQTKPVLVAADMMSPGTLLTKENTELVDTEVNKLRSSAFSYIEDLEGARLKRRIRPGQIISRNMLCFVCKGDRITISANTAGLALKTSGIAQQDGNVGDTIRVKNIGSKKLLSAVVASTSEVQVAF